MAGIAAFVYKDAFLNAQAHEAAYIRVQILHRDLSVSNILIDLEGQGFLCDWDMSRRTDSPYSPRRLERTVRHAQSQETLTHAACSHLQGTWQFMSVALLTLRDMPHGVSDDLESLFWVMLYLVLRYRPIASLAPVDVQTILKTLFDDHVHTAGRWTGGDRKFSFLSHGLVNMHDILDLLEASLPTPTFSTLAELYGLFRSYYAPGLKRGSKSTQQNMATDQDTARVQLTTHELVMSLILAGAEHAEWAQVLEDGAKDQIAQLVKQMDTPLTASRMERESASSALSQVSAASGASSKGSRAKRPHGSDIIEAPRKRGRGAVSLQLVSGGTSADVVQGDDAEGPPDAEDASNAEEEEDSAEEEDGEDDAEDSEETEENEKDEA